ncbi:MAG: hypothetical protein A2Z60_04590 [Nitrospirae bacterium RIFCSPLOWO2_02_42_7]|nr:MAG: hypothetical protein A2Z60_04590 [Nitrospirae bacterium RIFCSPLOWO2_02_42_7]
MTKRTILFIFILLFSVVQVYAGSYESIKEKYPADIYIVGIGEVESSKDAHKDKIRAEMLARLEIAKQIRIRIQEKSIDIMCEGEGKTFFDNVSDCRNQITTIIETTVDEILEGSKIIDAGEDKEREIYYAVAVLPRKEAVSKVKEGLQRVITHGGEESVTDEIRERSKILFEEIAREIIRVESREGIKIIAAEGKAILGEDSTPAQAKAIALNNARRRALEEAVGVNLHASSLFYNSELINDLIVTSTMGLIIKQDILEEKCYTESEKIYCVARIEAHVKPLSAGMGKRFSIIKASVQRPDSTHSSNNPIFQNNDEIQIRVTPGEDSYINIFSIDQYGNVIRLYPNAHIKPEIVLSGKEFVFPDDDLRDRGLKLMVTTPKGLSKGIESILIIATKEAGHFLSDATIQNPTITDLMRELSELEQSTWAEKIVGYEVRK